MKSSTSNFVLSTSLILLILTSGTTKCQAPEEISSQDVDTTENQGLSPNNLGSDELHNDNCYNVDTKKADRSERTSRIHSTEQLNQDKSFTKRTLVSQRQGLPKRRLLRVPVVKQSEDE